MISPPRILLAEDDENDVFFFKYAFESAGFDQPMQVVDNGSTAIRYLAGEGEFADRARFPMPDLLVLDLKMPVRNGLDVLRWLRTQPELGNLPVVVLTSSCDPVERDEAGRLGARSFMVKPVSLRERMNVARSIRQFCDAQPDD